MSSHFMEPEGSLIHSATSYPVPVITI